MFSEETGPSSPIFATHPDSSVTSGNVGDSEIGAGSILARSANVVFTGAPVFWSVQGSYITSGGNFSQPPPPSLSRAANNSEMSVTHDPRHDIADRSRDPFIRQVSGEDSDNPRKGKGRVQLYRQLDKEKLGVALHIPQPNARLSEAARRKGVCIGSIGKVTPERSFDYMFNICYDASDPINPPDLQPEEFTPIEPILSSHDIREFREFSSGSFLATSGIHREKLQGVSPRTMAKFSCDSNEGALLYMPEGAYYEKLTNQARLNDYIALHGLSLYEYVNSARSRQFRNGELSVVFSCRKATSWGIATFQSTTSEHTNQMEFIKKEQADGPSAGSRYMWDCSGVVQAKVGPEEENDDLGVDGDEMRISSLKNQCLFVRTLKIKLSEDVWERTFPAKIVVISSFDDEVAPYKTPTATPSSLSISPNPSFSPSSADLGCAESLPTSLSQRDSDSTNISDRSSGDEDYNDCMSSPPDEFQRLSDIVTDFLLDMKPTANVAISSDRDWSSCYSLDREASEILDDICTYNDICEQNGLVYFEPKEYVLSNSQQNEIANGLLYGDIAFPVFLFGRETENPQVYCDFLDSLIAALRDGQNLPGPIAFRTRPMLLHGHPLRVLSLENAANLASDFFNLHDSAAVPLTIPRLREDLYIALSSDSNGATIRCGQQLGQALIRRFWNLCHEDDLYEAIWVLSDTLQFITKNGGYIYRHLEVLLDLSTALFFRLQLLQCSEDLEALLLLLEGQKNIVMKSELCWIWQKGSQEKSSNMLRLRLFAAPTLDSSQDMSDVLIMRIFRPNTHPAAMVTTEHRREIENPSDVGKHGIIEWKESGRTLCPSPGIEDVNATLHGSFESLILPKKTRTPTDSTKPPRTKKISMIFKRLVNALRHPQFKSVLPSARPRLDDHKTALQENGAHHSLTRFNSPSPAISDSTLYEEVKGTKPSRA